MHILELRAENYKRLRVVEIVPKGRVIQITGKNGQGKTSVVDAIWTAIRGAKAMPEKPVRKGAERARIKLNLGEYVITRLINPGGTHSLTVENAKGVKVSSPQAVLDDLFNTLSFDPLEFVTMKPQQQIETLRQAAKLEIDIDALNAANQKDYNERTIVNREVERLKTTLATMPVQENLPKEKLDDASILAKLNEAGTANQKAQALFTAKAERKRERDAAADEMDAHAAELTAQKLKVADLERQLAKAKKELEALEAKGPKLQKLYDTAKAKYEAAPEGTLVDVAELTRELQHAQLVNREIDKRNRRAEIEAELRMAQKQADTLTRQIEDRNEQKAQALATAKLPVEGLSFTESQVLFNGIPLEQLGEGEQIRISTAIAMAANPKLRVLRVLHGEALDDDNLAVLAEMAEQHDFQVWVARVDSSGKVGIVMEDGCVKAEE